MPNPPSPKRTIKGTLPSRIGTYAPTTARLVQGKSSNKTADFLADLDPHDPGQQAFYREALTLPHPLETGKQINYGQLQHLLNSPQRAAALDAYRVSNRLDRAPTAEAYQQAAFDAAHRQLLQRGAANPDTLAFPPSAVEALRAPNTAQNIAHGNFAAAEGPQLTNAAIQAQRYADLGTAAPVMAAPGMTVRLVRGAAPTPAPVRTIPGTIATR